MVLVANGGMRTPSGALAHFLAAYTPAELSLARSDYLRPPLSPSPGQVQPRSSLSLRADSADLDAGRATLRPRMPHQSYSYSVHTLRRQPRAVSPPSPPSPPSPLSPLSPLSPAWAPEPCDCLPTHPIPPPELFDF